MQSSTNQYWSGLYDQGRDFTLARAQDITRFLTFTEPSTIKTNLDIGCGTGQLTRELFHRGYRCVGIDASSSAIERASSLTTVPADSLSYHHFDIEHDDLANLPSAPFGLITCKLVYAFIKEPQAFLQRVKSLLTPDGIFVIISPIAEDLPPDRQGIAAKPEHMEMLPAVFEQLAQYKDNGLIYFVGRYKA